MDLHQGFILGPMNICSQIICYDLETMSYDKGHGRWGEMTFLSSLCNLMKRHSRLIFCTQNICVRPCSKVIGSKQRFFSGHDYVTESHQRLILSIKVVSGKVVCSDINQWPLGQSHK